MKIKGKVSKAELDAMAAPLKELYVEAKDKKTGEPIKAANGDAVYVLDTEDMEHRDDISGLVSALESERVQGTARQTKITESEASIARLNAELETARKSSKSTTDVQSQIEAAKAELTNLHKAELAKATGLSDNYRSHLDTVMRKNAALAAITSPGEGSKRTKGSPE